MNNNKHVIDTCINHTLTNKLYSDLLDTIITTAKLLEYHIIKKEIPVYDKSKESKSLFAIQFLSKTKIVTVYYDLNEKNQIFAAGSIIKERTKNQNEIIQILNNTLKKL